MKTRYAVACLTVMSVTVVTTARAADLATTTTNPIAAQVAAPPPPPDGAIPAFCCHSLPGWGSAIDVGVQFDAGIMANPARPADGQNFGDVYTDHANQVQLNQVLLTATRPAAPDHGYDVGFNFQLLYGSDSRGNHYLGEFDHLISSRYQLDVVQANIAVHLPWFTAGGVDAKIGEFPSIMGLETLDPSTAPFYSHSFIFDWGVDLYNTGAIFTAHLNPTVDLYLGADTGNTTTFGSGDDNHAPAGYVGLGLNNLFGGKVTVLGTAHIGPEQPRRVDPNANGDERYYADILTTWHVTPTITSNTDINYLKDDYLRSEAYGVAQYLSVVLSPSVTFNARGELWRANNLNFVVNFPSNLGFVKAEEGLSVPAIVAPPTTFGELTLGITYKPHISRPLRLLAMRPEIRYERSLNGTRPYDAGRHQGSFLFGGDIILGF